MRKFFPELIPPIFLFILLLIFFAPILFLGESFIGSGLIYSDLMTLNYPLKHLLSQSLKDGALPFWTSLIGNGSPILAESQIGALYPFHLLLFRFLPPVEAFNLNLFLHFFLAAFGTYLFVRVSLKLGWASGLLSALAFSLSGFMIMRAQQTNIVLVVAFLPWVFFLIEEIASRQKIFLVFPLALVFAFQILAGYFEMFYYTLLAGGVFLVLLVIFQKNKFRPLLLLGSSLILAVGLSAPQIFSTWEMTKYSIRSEGLTLESASSSIWPPSTFSLFVNPRVDFYQGSKDYKPSDVMTFSGRDLYGYLGIIPLFLALFSIFTCLPAGKALFRKKMVLIFVILLVLTFILALGRSTQVFSIVWETVPGLKFFRFPSKWLFFIEFCLAILAAFGWEGILGKVRKKGMIGILGGLGVLVVFADLWFNNLPKQLRVKSDFWFSDPAVVETVKDGLKEGNFRLYSHGTNNLDFSTASDFELQKEFLNILPPNTNIPFKMPANREWYTLFLERQNKLARLTTTLDPQSGILRLSPQMKKSLDLQGVRYLLSDLAFSDPDLALVKEFPLKKPVSHFAYLLVGGQMQNVPIPVEKTYVYENLGVLPRALWVDQVRVMEGKPEDEIFEAVLGGEFDPTKEVVLEEAPSCGDGACRSLPPSDVLAPLRALDGGPPLASPVHGETAQGEPVASIINYQEQSVEIETESERDGFLVLSDTYYPGWRATVDGKETKILRANFAFRAVEVPQGKHLVRFTFEPTYWRLGLWISVGTLIMVFLGLGYSLWKKI